jgi:cytochrome c biogenesis protein CcmG, thiol:disulfide interchange protein DsbE
VVAQTPVAPAPVAAPPVAAPAPAGAPPNLAAQGKPAWLGIMFDGHNGTTRVQSVVVGGPAERAGVAAGDLVASVDGAPMAKAADVIAHVRALPAGAIAHVVVSRKGRDVPLDITLEERPSFERLQQRLVDHPAPDFALTTVAGPPIGALADLRGHVAIVDFWATWCGPCAYAMPHLVALAHKYPELRVVGISDEDAGDITAYVKAHGIDYTVARDADDVITGHYLVTGLPTLVIVDKAGVVRALHVGAGDFDVIEADVQRLLK